jgi:hypothetical protein
LEASARPAVLRIRCRVGRARGKTLNSLSLLGGFPAQIGHVQGHELDGHVGVHLVLLDVVIW